MTKEEKQLLLKDLCARFPYGVKVSLFGWDKFPCTITKIDIKLKKIFCPEANSYQSIDVIKSYLRSMSSMTEEEDKEWQLYKSAIADSCDELLEKRIAELHDWFCRKHFDYRGLISMGLVLEAPEGMYKID